MQRRALSAVADRPLGSNADSLERFPGSGVTHLSGGHLCSYCFRNQAAIPGGLKLALAFAIHSYVVAASVILEGDMKRLMNVAYPMSKELQRR